MKNLSIPSLAILMLTFFSECAHDTQKDAKLTVEAPNTNAAPKDSVSIEAKLAAAQEGSSHVSEIVFAKGSNSLSRENTQKIETALTVADKKAKLKHLTVVAWADSELPKGQEKLGEAELALAQKRGEVVEHYLQNQHPGVGTDVVNMAKRPGKLKKFLKTDDVRIQQALNISGTGSSKASHVILIIENDQD